MQSRATGLLAAGRLDEARTLIAQLLDLSRRFGIRQRIAAGLMLDGYLALASGQQTRARERIEEGFAMWAAYSPGLLVTTYAATAARALAQAGDAEGVRHFLDAGAQAMASTQERAAEAELLRLRGWLARNSGDLDAAEQSLRSALDLAKAQGARLVALRTAIDLVNLAPGAAPRKEALAALKETFAGFSEGFSSGTLREAAELLRSSGI